LQAGSKLYLLFKEAQGATQTTQTHAHLMQTLDILLLGNAGLVRLYLIKTTNCYALKNLFNHILYCYASI
jgi:hypothetical protein